jgi:hypothetical protein
MFSRSRPNLVCGVCGSEVKQEGGFMKCQNVECRMSIPIDIEDAATAYNTNILERDSQTPDA